jgi:hypothetical protein
MAKGKPYSIRRDKVDGPPQGEPWCWLPRKLLQSHVWKARSIHCVRFLDFLLIEHMNHAGTENGNLPAPWAQLVEHGLGRRYIGAAVEEAAALRLIAVNRGGPRATKEAAMNRYRLTFYATRTKNEDGHEYWIPPTNDWERVSAKSVREFFAKRPAWNAKNFAGAHGVTEDGHTVKPTHSGNGSNPPPSGHTV